MFHRIPLVKTYISLISSNSLRSLQRIEGTVLNGCRCLKKNSQNQEVAGKDKDWVHHVLQYSNARRHKGLPLLGALLQEEAKEAQG